MCVTVVYYATREKETPWTGALEAAGAVPALCNPMSASQCSPQCSRTQKTPSGGGNRGRSRSVLAVEQPSSSSRASSEQQVCTSFSSFATDLIARALLYEKALPCTHAPITPTGQHFLRTHAHFHARPHAARCMHAAHTACRVSPPKCVPRPRAVLAPQEGGHDGTGTAAEVV